MIENDNVHIRLLHFCIRMCDSLVVGILDRRLPSRIESALLRYDESHDDQLTKTFSAASYPGEHIESHRCVHRPGQAFVIPGS
jgi:hypothetical protein